MDTPQLDSRDVGQYTRNQRTPLVSIIITTYNSVSVISECLSSLFQQDYQPIEIIIVDNCSTDGTPAVLRQLDHRVRVFFNRTNTGFSAGQNLAISKAQGDWLLSLNPDVILQKD